MSKVVVDGVEYAPVTKGEKVRFGRSLKEIGEGFLKLGEKYPTWQCNVIFDKMNEKITVHTMGYMIFNDIEGGDC